MTLARKGSRRITVDDIVYRWAVAPNDEPGVGIVVELAEHPAQRLLSWVEHGVIIAPGLVRAAILDGLRAGWNPRATGRDFVRRVPEFSVEHGALAQCAACDYFSITKRGWDICPVCFWEDDGSNIADLDRWSGANHQTLRQARDNFRTLGACGAGWVNNVLKPEQRARFRRVVRGD